MARDANSRSPSPTGSRRDDDRRRYRERDSHRRRDRSRDRRDERRNDDSYRPGRRDRSRDNKRRSRERERERPQGRDRSQDRRRRRSRERDHGRRDRRDDSRDETRRRGDGSTDSKRASRPADGVDKGTRTSGGKAQQSPLPQESAKSSEEQKRAERLAKLEAWKKKQAEEKERKERELAATGGPQSLLDEIQKNDNPLPEATTITTPYAGKFDPKAIAKRKASAGGSSGPTALGAISLPESAKALSSAITSASTIQLDRKPTASANSQCKLCPAPITITLAAIDILRVATPLLPRARGNVSGFGFGNKQGNEGEKSSGKRALDFGDEESTRKKLERLPTPPLGRTGGSEQGAISIEVGDQAAEQEEDDDDGDIDMQDAGTEEETAAAARLAAEKREERLLTQNLALQAGEDVEMAEASEAPLAPTPEVVAPAALDPVQTSEGMKVDEDIDPLDAFMCDLGDAVSAPKTGASFGKSKKSKATSQQPEAIFGDDDDVDLKAIEGNPDDILAMASKARKKKDIPAINHSKMNYEPFRKNFYTEPAELAEMTKEELADLRLELDGITIKGVDPPKPVQKWSQCGLGVQTLHVIQKLGYEKPSSIQTQAIPAIMSGRDIIGVAKTGSGKTIAFLLPMFRHIKDQKPLESLDGPIGLIMTPTRELATQIHRECKPFLKALNLRAVCAYGGAPIKEQIADLKRGAEIIVCTPGRMIDLLAANSGRVTNMRRVTYIVLDEADRMFDMGFEPQVMKILTNVRPDRQAILFSATFPPKMEALARKVLHKPLEIVVGGRSVVAPEITQIVEVRLEDSKFYRLLELLGNLYAKDEDARTLIFVDRQESADNLLGELMRKGYPCMSLHGGKDQVDRDSTIQDFKAGVTPIVIATSVAARGLDVKQLKLVVNYDAPNHLEDYVHRAGRTGRAGNTGTAVTFLTEDQERYSIDIAKALRQSGQKVPEAVQKLVDSFLEKVKSGKEKASGSGFGGKGLEKLDQERDAARTRERKTYKTGEEGDDEEKEEEKKDDDIIVRAATAAVPAAAAPPKSLPGVPKGIDLDGKITVHKTETSSSSGTTGGSKNPLDRVGQAVADITSRLNKQRELRSGVPIDNKGPDAGAFHATLEINDFPQKARWAVTNRTNVAKILEATGTSITTKGSFYPTGKEPQAGENPKLYILVEGDTEVVVTNAMRELMRLLKEGTAAAVDSESRAPASGRYNVV
ncbi:MAG: putative ATP-dependent RNA helicase ddx46 [Trizodia sp. TS-e1964]|nr:MAG: putative ATP-dependent RNA helicase ddx46 [Trizodia sp. TS-e1964]